MKSRERSVLFWVAFGLGVATGCGDDNSDDTGDAGAMDAGDAGMGDGAVDGGRNSTPVCLAPSTPPPPPPEDGEQLNYSCNGGRFPGTEPPALDTFAAFYTRLPGDDQAADPAGSAVTHTISGEYADVVVNLPDLGQLRFGRTTSYHPVWHGAEQGPMPLPELVDRSGGDGSAEWPDRLNRYAYARIVRNTASEVRVHYRYAPDHCVPTAAGWVHEVFSISSDGGVRREVHRGATSIAEAASAANNWEQQLQLVASGVTAEAAAPRAVDVPQAIHGMSAMQTDAVTDSVLALRFDEGVAGGGASVTDSAMGASGRLDGRFPTWHPGISGTSVAFDGYTTKVSVPASSVPTVSEAFTLSAWVALAAYPFGTAVVAGRASTDGKEAWTPDTVEGGAGTYDNVNTFNFAVAEQLGRMTPKPVEVGGNGYLLAVDALGQAVVGARNGSTWNTVSSGSRLPLHTWVHLAGVYDASAGTLRVYVNGESVASTAVTGGLVVDDRLDFTVGLNSDPQWMVAGSELFVDDFRSAVFGVEGLIDEVRMFGRALSEAEVRSEVAVGSPGSTPVLPQRSLPSVAGSAFGATQQTLQYHGQWNRLFHDSSFDDVVVNYETLPTATVFWQAMSHGPAWVSEAGHWAHVQSMESGDDRGLAEHMSDKQARHTHVRVIENTPARVVVQWRYSPVTVGYRLWAEANEISWVDEFYTLYPDGTTVRSVRDWFCSTEGGPAMDIAGTYVLSPPGSGPMDVLEPSAAAVVVSADGTRRTSYNLLTGTPAAMNLSDGAVIFTKTRSTHNMYRGIPTGRSVGYHSSLVDGWSRGDIEDISDPAALGRALSPLSTGNHWPVSQIPNDGRTAIYTDRVTHSEWLPDVRTTDYLLYGFATTPDDALPMINGWNNPPTVESSSAISQGYDVRQHAYLFEGPANALTADFAGSQDVVNPAIVVLNWNGPDAPSVRVDGAPVAARVGIHFNGGVRTLVLWLPTRFSGASLTVE